MQLDSVRSLKLEAFQTLVAPAGLRARRAQTLSLVAEGPEAAAAAAPPPPAIALGISGGTDGKDFQLAVRLQQGADESYPGLTSQLRDLSRGEIEIRHIGRVRRHQGLWEQGRQRPLLIGASVGQFNVTAGTIGAFATSNKTGKHVILSNNHVLADQNRGNLYDAVLQPGRYDGGQQGTDSVATLSDFIPLLTNSANLIDAAVAALDDGIDFDTATLTGLGILRGFRATPMRLGESVSKVGRTSGVTYGTVSSVELDNITVDYDIGSVRFDRQAEVEGAGGAAFSQGGDSGSLVVDAEQYAVGLLFAGSDTGGGADQSLTYVNDLSLVLSTLELTLDT
jgi:hypothetical protein